MVKVFQETDPTKIPWASAGADYIAEATGVFTSGDKAGLHLQGGAKKAIISSGIKKKSRSDKSLVDKISATIILQDYLQAYNSNS